MTNSVLIAPFKTGIDTDISPWIAPMDSFRELNNFHIRHGFLQKRNGFRIFGRMIHNPSTDITGITQADPAVVSAAGHTFTVGQEVLITGVEGMTEVNGNIYTVASIVAVTSFELFQSQADSLVVSGITNSNPAVVTVSDIGNLQNGDIITINNVVGMVAINGLTYTVANIDLNTFELTGIDSIAFVAYTSGGTVSIAIDSIAFTAYSGAAGRADLFVADRIMGIFRYYNPDGTKNTLAFDTTRASVFNGATNRFDPLDAADIMSGLDTDYIWVENWQHSGSTNRMYFTNGKAFNSGSLDGIRYYDPGTSTTATTSFNTNSLGGTRILYGCKLMFAIKQRLVCLNVYEHDTGPVTTTNFPQRARWCQAQGPSNWDDTVAGGGGFVDAPTGEQIISARALQDVIIVFFTNSVWTLRPVPDPALPFRWDRINDFRACNGKMASVAFDRYVVAIGVRGITATDGVETRRVDDRIQDFTSDEINVDQFQKVYCERDYDNSRAWSLFAGVEASENSKSLILDEDSSAYSQYVIAMNCLGYGNYLQDYGLEDFIAANDLDLTIEEFTDETLQDYFWNENSDAFLGGDIVGIVHVMQSGGSDNGADIPCDLKTNAWNPYQNESKEAQLNYIDLYVDVEKDTQITVEFFKNTETAPYATRQSDLLPPLGFIALVSNITQANPANVTAGSHGLTTGDTIYIYGVKGMTQINDGYVVTVVDEGNFTLDGINSTSFTAFSTGGQVVKNKFYRTKSWKRILAGGIGFQHSMRITSDGSSDPLKIDAFKPAFRPRGQRSIN